MIRETFEEVTDGSQKRDFVGESSRQNRIDFDFVQDFNIDEVT